MNSKALKFIKNFSYTLKSNLIALIVSSLVILIIPRLIGVEEYGYWQLYLFYSSYVGFLHFGWNDGIYLRYGGKEYNELDKRLFFSQFYMLVILQLILGGVILIITPAIFIAADRIFIFQMLTLCLFITNVRFMLLFVLQGTNRIKEYARITVIDKMVYCFLIIIFLVSGVRDYRLMISADLIGRFISLTYAMFCCREIVFRGIKTFYFSFGEAIENINVGIKLMFANISSMLIIGVVRFGIERSWDVSTFGKISLTLSVTNLMMLFIGAVGTVMFPILRRTNEKRLAGIYVTMRDFLMIVLLGALIIYYPLRAILASWLPNYADGLMYMAIIFPICIFEGKMSLLINTYLKALRKEKMMLKINVLTLLLSCIITFITTIIFKNLNFSIVSIVLLLGVRCVWAEFFLSKQLGISVNKDILLELIMILIFILTGWFSNWWFYYVLVYLCYLIIKRKDIICALHNVKLLMKA